MVKVEVADLLLNCLQESLPHFGSKQSIESASNPCFQRVYSNVFEPLEAISGDFDGHLGDLEPMLGDLEGYKYIYIYI